MVNYGSLPFLQAIEFFRKKENLGTQGWTDIWQGEHAKSFVIAGATRDDLLADMRDAVDDAIANGTTLYEFRKTFDSIVEKYGWAYKGGQGWRTNVIYSTNIRTAYMAGRHEQMQAVSRTRPYWRYKHSNYVDEPRQEHKKWDGLVLRWDDPFWETHYPPNGWGCKCKVVTMSLRDLIRSGRTAPDTAPMTKMETVTVGVNSPNPRTVETPEGIDPGWGYNVGEAA